MLLTTRVSRAAIVALLSLCAGATLLLASHDRADASDTAVSIADAPDLEWGFKATWRGYAQNPQASDGATMAVTPSGPAYYQLAWAFDSGSYDPATQTTQMNYKGTVVWHKYKASELGRTKPPGYTGPETDPYLLDVTISDPQITIGPDSSVLTAIASSRDQFTWEMHHYGRVPIVNLDVLGVTPMTADGVTQWSGIPATVATEGSPAFAGNYPVGLVVDEVGFSYTGPGGAPDFSEHWDTPGAAKLRLVQNALFFDGEQSVTYRPLWIDYDNMIVHSMREGGVIDGATTVRLDAFSLKEMRRLGEPFVASSAVMPGLLTGGFTAYDSTSNRGLYRGQGESGLTRWLRFDVEDEEYEHGLLSDPKLVGTAFMGPNSARLAWDTTRDRGYRIERVVPPGVASNDFDNHQWQLLAFSEGEDGIWSKKTFALPSFPAGQNQNGYATAYHINTPSYAVASDGSLIVLATVRFGLPTTATIPPAYRIVFDEADEQVEVEPLPIPELPNQNGKLYTAVQATANGHVALIGTDGVVHLKIDASGEIDADDVVSFANVELTNGSESWRYAIDPADGTVWFGGASSQKLAAIKDGAFAGGEFFKERNPRGGPVIVGDDHFVYAQTNDGSPGEFGGSSTWGYGKFERLGFVPTVTGQPQDDAVALGVGEMSEEATFTSTATGDPAPDRQWQVKPPGAVRFSDLAGETGETLTVAATRGDDGSEYRAVYSNAAGEVAADPATLAVEYAPAVMQDPVNVAAIEGDDAELALLSNGNPAPSVTWQRRVGGFWQPIDPDDENFEVDGHRLTVLDTNVEQSGALFRARLTNPHGSVLTKQAKLTVEPRVSIPPQGIDLDRVSLDWTGNPEMQKAPPFGNSNYFSAGFSDGEEATYKPVDGNAAVYQVSSAGSEALASWPTRADHVSSGGKQVARLYGGDGRVEADGSATVEWDGSFSVNFYGGLVPFTITDPELSVDVDGGGTLRADLSGCASSQANPDVCTPFPPRPDVTVATFSGVEIDPSGAVSITPDYAGVEVTVPVPFAPQDRVTSGWGAWPQSFVDFHVETGLSSYWYSSGGAFDPYKKPDPFVVDFDGAEPPAPPLVDPPPSPQPPQPPPPGPARKVAQISVAGGTKALGRGRVAVLATLACPDDGFCAIIAPARVKLKVGGKVRWGRVIAPRTVEAGRRAKVKVKLSKSTLRSLGRRTATGRLRLAVRTRDGVTRRTMVVKLRKQPRRAP